MNRLALAAGVLGFLAVALGAFGAHGLEGKLSPQAQDWWETATFYGLVHAVAAFSLALHARPGLARAGWAFVIGAVVFSGSLYAMALGGPRMLGMATPFGGVSFLVGWALAAIAGAKR
ncbi:DUF423 domain-containing protein [Hyphococcus luteus]|uniref:DUF423 domain-containing protein n=1 Tax=Hyphococcus luteus TaxID=2058213 RepID=A0A2S7KAY8_9PROT|nr:DUF423 domain-containing protein [Marinicaulis flavus]PQA89643.1 DUF423 domain-containing protein [Marinicaulis flavus]